MQFHGGQNTYHVQVWGFDPQCRKKNKEHYSCHSVQDVGMWSRTAERVERVERIPPSCRATQPEAGDALERGAPIIQ